MEWDYSDDICHIGNQIRQIRERANVSQEELADRLGVSVLTIHRIENGIRQPSLETLLRFVDTMDIPLPMLFPMRMRNRSDALAENFMKLTPAHQGVVRNTVGSLTKNLLSIQN